MQFSSLACCSQSLYVRIRKYNFCLQRSVQHWRNCPTVRCYGNLTSVERARLGCVIFGCHGWLLEAIQKELSTRPEVSAWALARFHDPRTCWSTLKPRTHVSSRAHGRLRIMSWTRRHSPKTTEKITMNMVTQPLYDPNEIPFTQFSWVRRHGLCAQHGEIRTMSFDEASDNTPSVNIENSTLCDVTIFSPWRWPSALCSKQVLVGFLHLFGILMEPGTM